MTRRLAISGIFGAFAILLSYIEALMPPIIPVAYVKLGLSNIVVMAAIILISAYSGLMVITIKSLFVLITRGLVAFSLSLSGGIISLLLIVIILSLHRACNKEPTLILVSVMGAIAHNIAQLATASIFYTSKIFSSLILPITAFGIIAGILNAMILRVILPTIRRVKI